MKSRLVAAVAACIVVFGGQAFAHHGAPALYDVLHPINVKGTVTEFVWSNPHAQIYMDVKDPSGKVVNWAIETVGPGALAKAGWATKSRSRSVRRGPERLWASPDRRSAAEKLCSRTAKCSRPTKNQSPSDRARSNSLMRAFIRPFTFVLAALLMAPGFALAQSASIAGVVKDTSGAVLPGVTVEASSPSLIEKTRAVVTDGSGQYRIVDLVPGTYSVTFKLEGFNTVQRGGIEISGSFTANVNADLRVGALEETITVTGETPVVDVSSATQQRVLTQEALDAAPVDRVPAYVAALIPGVTIGTQDVGGTQGNPVSGAGMTTHGSRTTDIRTNSNGVSVQSLESGASAQGVPNMLIYQEVTVDSSATSAEQDLGGVTINLIPREGGNTFSGTVLGAFANDAMQGSNLTDELKNRGLRTPDSIRKNWDINPGFGGPIKKDSLWFFATGRYTGANNYAGGAFYNVNGGNPNAFTYVPDTSRPAFNQNIWKNGAARVTWQATAKNKFAVGFDQSEGCQCPRTVSAVLAPEAAPNSNYVHDRAFRGEWTAPLTNRLLMEAVLFQRRLPSTETHPTGFAAAGISAITEQSTGLTYAATIGPNTVKVNQNVAYRASLSYVTGSHAVKVGYNDGQATREATNLAFDSPVSYRFNNGVPNQLTELISPVQANSRQDHDLGLFVQDKWTIKRLTLGYGLRYSRLTTSFPEQSIGATALAPALNLNIPEAKGLDWQDVVPRLGAVYNIFGDGKTAVKVSLNKYVAGQGLFGSRGSTLIFGDALNPVNRLVLSTTRNWADANRNFVPDCDLTNPSANGECQAMANQNFGRTAPGTTYDPATLSGWNRRGYNWEFSTGVQHEILPRTSVDVTYFRRSYGNFVVTDNRSVSASDYTQYSIAAPVDPRLPGGGGYAVTGLYDLNPNKVGQVDNYLTFAKNYGKQTERWNGVDITVNARPRGGVSVMGGLSTGRTTTDVCDVVSQLPEMLFGQPTLSVTNAASVIVPQQYCHSQQPFLTQVKFLGSYMIPRIGVQVAATIQSIAGPQLPANYVATNAVVAPSLGRPLSGGANNVTVSIVEPGTMYGDRLNQVDLRFGKVLKFGTTRTNINVDLYNALNANPVLTQSAAYATWLQPQSILMARFVKLGVQFNF
jgi:hypothetical protein